LNHVSTFRKDSPVPALTESHEQVGGGGETDNSTGVSMEETLSRGGRTEHAVKDEEAAEHAEEANPEEERSEVGKISHGGISFRSQKRFMGTMMGGRLVKTSKRISKGSRGFKEARDQSEVEIAES
jgi:hypothetical protein